MPACRPAGRSGRRVAGAAHRRRCGIELTFLDYDSTAFSAGILVTSAHIAKGLEFDAVIVPEVDAENYANEMDKSMLYIACTRAMHELYLTHEGELSPHLAFAKEATTGSVTTAATA
ncbi:ATP-binding domain-containing protein [Saccharomonospora iraqiensis]|uniref:ATP-binding domain-containing protein n=1 Tax=Saccharomonospora iraqiensis TaxID=52698 RepID=UPI00022E24E1|nr:ATP-binding domain-containing protein [Saccharomonospora iraqiensis]